MKELKFERTITSGIAIAEAAVIDQPQIAPDKNLISDVQFEIKRFDNAISRAKKELAQLAETNPIFAAHIEILEDPSLYEEVSTQIKIEKKDAEWALTDAVEFFRSMFEQIEDEYLRARNADIQDVGRRLLYALRGVSFNPFEQINREVIIVAPDLAPSDTANMDFNLVRGFITGQGGVTSHVAIIAKSIGLPALVGANGILNEVRNGDMLILDAREGVVIVNPDAATLKKYQDIKDREEAHKKHLQQESDLPAVTLCGRHIETYANVGNIRDIKKALEAKAEGIGLFRTEFLYMDNAHFPTENEQFEAYKEAALLMGEKELIIRTLDIGGDKKLPYYRFEPEENPFLGLRSIRFCLSRKDIFKTQLRALLRAAVYGNIKIMYPMITSVEELVQANAVLDECKAALEAEKAEFRRDIPVGIMIETPSSVLLAEKLAEIADFFSIGTNDLTQYVLAADRGNPKLSYLYSGLHPAVLRSIKKVTDAAHAAGIKAGICGELAGDGRALPLLLGLGLEEFSMNASSIAEFKHGVRNISIQKARQISEKALEMGTVNEVEELISSNP